MRSLAPTLRAVLGGGLLVLGMLLPVAPARAATYPTSCLSSAGTGTCAFSCSAGDTITIVVGGSAHVQGNGICGGGRAFCDGQRTCTGTDVATTSGDGFCDLAAGTWAYCSAGGSLPDPCELAESLCNLLQEVDLIVCPIFAILYPPEGDIPGVWDCPPYGN